MNNREELSEKCNPEKKEKVWNRNNKYIAYLAIELVLAFFTTRDTSPG